MGWWVASTGACMLVGACMHAAHRPLVAHPLPAGMHFFLLVAVRSSVLCLLVLPLLWRHRVNRE